MLEDRHYSELQKTSSGEPLSPWLFLETAQNKKVILKINASCYLICAQIQGRSISFNGDVLRLVANVLVSLQFSLSRFKYFRNYHLNSYVFQSNSHDDLDFVYSKGGLIELNSFFVLFKFPSRQFRFVALILMFSTPSGICNRFKRFSQQSG